MFIDSQTTVITKPSQRMIYLIVNKDGSVEWTQDRKSATQFHPQLGIMHISDALKSLDAQDFKIARITRLSKSRYKEYVEFHESVREFSDRLTENGNQWIAERLGFSKAQA